MQLVAPSAVRMAVMAKESPRLRMAMDLRNEIPGRCRE